MILKNNMEKHLRLVTLCVCSLIVFSTLSACKKNIMDSITMPADNTNGKTYLALGDSYTIGESVAASERFSMQAVAFLKDSGLQINTPQIIAQTGWTTTDLLIALQRENPPKNFDLVTLLIGVNNQYQGKSIADYRSEFKTLVVKSIEYARDNKNHVIVLSIPDYSVMPFSKNLDKQKIAREIDDYNYINKQVCQQMGVTYLNVTAISREAATNKALIAEDGLHPSAEQYARWSALLAPLIKARF